MHNLIAQAGRALDLLEPFQMSVYSLFISAHSYFIECFIAKSSWILLEVTGKFLNFLQQSYLIIHFFESSEGCPSVELQSFEFLVIFIVCSSFLKKVKMCPVSRIEGQL